MRHPAGVIRRGKGHPYRELQKLRRSAVALLSPFRGRPNFAGDALAYKPLPQKPPLKPHHFLAARWDILVNRRLRCCRPGE
jgi:hypothetical protein